MTSHNESPRYRFQCNLCSGPDWFGDELDPPPKCPKCGRMPVRYFLDDDDEPYCFLHRTPMRDTYQSSSQYIFIHYGWLGSQHLFPNAKLFQVDSDSITPDDCIIFHYCADCERTHERWWNESS